MATFFNQAQLSYNGNIINSNVATGELTETLAVTKTATVDTYSRNSDITYVISLVNSGSAPLTNLAVTDNLGSYTVGTTTVYPLSYVDGSARLFINGVPQAVAPTVTAGPPLTFSGVTIPANSNAIIIYDAVTTNTAPLNPNNTITNTVTVSGGSIVTPVTASETLTVSNEPDLTISKSINPSTVVENSPVTYTFIIQNYGNTAADVTDNVIITDTFNPILTNLAVSFNGTPWAENTNYTYNTATGLFTTNAGQITVPAATITQDPTTGVNTITPGVATLTVTGII